MQEPSSDNPEPYIEIDENEIAAKLSIFVDNDGEVMYNCDWEPTQEGIIGVASIFYKLLVDNLSDQILEEVRSQCVSNGAEDDFMAIGDLIKIYSSQQANSPESIDNDVVIPPDRIINI
tara:strand:+ start:3559 stop:3915 length:357 start_codon:yes stop_codon:yes gene_type:complete